MIFPCNEAGKNVEAHVAMSPGLSLFRREEPVDGDRDESYALHSYRSTAVRLIPITPEREGLEMRKGIHSKPIETQGFLYLGHANWTICSLLS